jgi:crotonobetainyl-CoA:carnitine CoA-transferase CaiB-like acyl-CoA transferase
MTSYELAASCLPDPRAERAHLTALLPAGVLTTGRVTRAPARGRAATTDRSPARDAGITGDCAVLAWARSGSMWLTGQPSGPPLAPSAPVLPRAVAIADVIGELSGRRGRQVNLEVDSVLADRAALNGWHRRGRVSANGTCQLLPCADGWLAVNLSRPVDMDSLPALLGRELAGDPWHELRAHAAARRAPEVAAAAQLVGIPAAVLGSEPPAAPRFSRLGEPGDDAGPVLDLSAMWAGPLCASILSQAGWHVLKVEDVRRPDGARFGQAQFYASLHAGSPAIRLDFATPTGQAELVRLADQAGIIVESSRPRALRRLGLVPEDWLAAAPGRIWVSITGYGREDPQQRVAFGDDAAAAGGLVARGPDGLPVFCGDAIADPLTGLHAGLAALAASSAGGGILIDAAMAGVCADMIRPSDGPVVPHRIAMIRQSWTVSHGDGRPVLVS